MSEQKRLFLLDGHALIYRAYFAFISNPRINSKGLNTSAIFGFTNTLLDLLKSENPSHIAAVFDPKGKTFRHELYEKYKANRQETPEDLKASIPEIFKLLEAFKIPVLQVENYEADDVIGTIAKQAAKEGFQVFMMTPDKDYCQLVEENIFVYKPKSFGNGIEIMGINEVNEKFSISNPEQVIDILGLWGDSSDNIPGAPGIGEKTSKKLIQDYGSIESIFENLDSLKGKQKEVFINFKDQILLSKVLATIKTDVDITFSAQDCLLSDYDTKQLSILFNEYEFSTLINKVLAKNQQSPLQSPQTTKPKEQNTTDKQLDLVETEDTETTNEFTNSFSTITDTEHNYELIDTKEKRNELISKLLKCSEICFDTETTSLNTIDAEIVGLAFSIKAKEAYYIPFPDDFDVCKNILNEFKIVFESKEILKIGQNLKYDIGVLANYDLQVSEPIFDTLLAHYLIQPESKHGLDALSQQFLNYEMVSIESLIGKKGKDQVSFRTVEVELAKEYAGEDADITFQIKPLLQSLLVEKGQYELFKNIEVPLVPVLSAVERTGVSVDSASLKELSSELKEQAIFIENKIFSIAGTTFNISSPKQLGEILFDKLKISDQAKRTKTKQYQTGEDVLQKLVNEHEIVKLILEYRSLKKLISTYIDSLPELIHHKTNRIHTSFNQAVVATGRLSSNNPNLQNIPIRSENGKEVRRAFVAGSEDYVFLSADYSQIELRVIAHFSEDPNFIQAYLDEEDIHAATAAKIFQIPLTSVTDEQRRQAKAANFAISYGASAFGLSQSLNVPRKDAQFLIDGYFSTYPRVKDFMNAQIAYAHQHGFVETLFGRRRYLPDIHSNNQTVRGFAERNAINAPIQGTAADIIKIAMIRIFEQFREQGLQSKMIMQVHDELNFDVHKSELLIVKQIVKNQMEKAVSLKVPLKVQIGVGANWLDAH
ncbi:MAG: DNA polymerase I [Bacteroidales bacterium]|nr:DNA polymerase I [Bacteroidales bacterium]